MKTMDLAHSWFKKWNSGDFRNLPITESFKHTSPFGTVEGKADYIAQIEANQDKFLGYSFEIHDEIFKEDHGCVRYTAVQGDFRLDVSEWYYAKGDLIDEIISYYHIGEIREERQLVEN